jgi:hypothetical protein
VANVGKEDEAHDGAIASLGDSCLKVFLPADMYSTKCPRFDFICILC